LLQVLDRPDLVARRAARVQADKGLEVLQRFGVQRRIRRRLPRPFGGGGRREDQGEQQGGRAHGPDVIARLYEWRPSVANVSRARVCPGGPSLSPARRWACPPEQGPCQPAEGGLVRRSRDRVNPRKAGLSAGAGTLSTRGRRACPPERGPC